MPETVEKGGNVIRWPIANIVKDLFLQGGYKGIEFVLFPDDRERRGEGRTPSGTIFYLTWIYGVFTSVTMNRPDGNLVIAFARVLGYYPFCRYVTRDNAYPDDDLITYEWCTHPQMRFGVLQEITNIGQLAWIEEAIFDVFYAHFKMREKRVGHPPDRDLVMIEALLPLLIYFKMEKEGEPEQEYFVSGARGRRASRIVPIEGSESDHEIADVDVMPNCPGPGCKDSRMVHQVSRQKHQHVCLRCLCRF